MDPSKEARHILRLMLLHWEHTCDEWWFRVTWNRNTGDLGTWLLEAKHENFFDKTVHVSHVLDRIVWEDAVPYQRCMIADICESMYHATFSGGVAN